ncbi:Oleosin [Melia azedarach]|uniref:Oleosin n=1 Tax=Melia azedarach TaxID=155640 RepID=A0ACC1XNF3_MELAZ|nr:Oleosin [Melia azedarach]
MAEHRQTQYQQPQQQQQPTDAIKGMLPARAPSKTQVLAIVTVLPVGGTLLLLSGLTLAGTLIGLAVTTPLFVIFSPVLVPAALVIGLAITGFLTSGAFAITALSALSWMARFLRRIGAEHAKRSMQDTAGQLGQKAKETGQAIQTKAQEVGRDRDVKDKEGGKT